MTYAIALQQWPRAESPPMPTSEGCQGDRQGEGEGCEGWRHHQPRVRAPGGPQLGHGDPPERAVQESSPEN